MLAVRLLGTVVFESDGVECPFSLPDESVLLFAKLLVAGSGVRCLRVELADALWPGWDPSDARTQLARHFDLLLAALPPGEPYLGADGDALWRAEYAGLTCDVDTFERNPNPYAPEFMFDFVHPWVRRVRRQLAKFAVRGLLRRADEQSAAGDEEGAIGNARFAMEIDAAEVARIGRGNFGVPPDDGVAVVGDAAGRSGDVA